MQSYWAKPRETRIFIKGTDHDANHINFVSLDWWELVVSREIRDLDSN